MSDLLYQIALTKISGVGPKTARQLVAYSGGVKSLFESSRKQLLKINGIGKSIVDSILDKDIFIKAEQELIFIEENNIQTYFYLDKEYPRRLIHFQDSPLLLYAKGNMDLNPYRTVGIVGTRKPSEWGKAICEEIVEGLKDYGVSIVSGLAYGIDVTSHKASLKHNIPTIGCLGHGLHMIYPARHRSVAKDMMDDGGLLTEFDSTQKPDAPHFPMRNRVIAGLSDALIVVESARKGGSMITAEIANTYNKDVFAVPGRVRDANAQGCNALIKQNKAHLLESAADVAYIMGWQKEEESKGSIQKQMFLEFNDKEQGVVDILRSKDSEAIDALSYQTGFSQSELSTLLLELEFKGAIKSLPGKRYMLV